jgi:threonylcarbamoyladenosine tRNA methylthiotransferase MtaB
VKIQDGCDKKCSYCVVRFARGKSRSRAVPEILNEVRRLVANGYREVVLTGIHIGSFGTDDGTKENRLPELMERTREVEGLLRVRLSSIDPNEISPGLIEAIRNSPQVCRHLHVPLQSGSDRILGKMNRGYSREEYLNILSLLKKDLPDFSVTTDVMVGFPGETDDDFEESLRVVSQAEFSKVHIFPFSRRPGTPADRLPDHVPPRVVKERVSRLSSEAEAVALKRRQKLNGAVVEVLVEREFQLTSRKGLPDFFNGADAAHEGFSSNYLRTVFLDNGEKTETLKNRLVRVRVEAFDERRLFGRQV